MYLQRLALDTQGLQWQMAPGSQAAIQYGADAVVVRDLRLVSGDQEIIADGTFGRRGDALNVTMTNVDLAGVDVLLLRPPRFSGRLDAKGTVTGSRSAPRVEAVFQVNQGGFRQFRYDSLAGTAPYTGAGVTVDARLQQNPTH